MALADIDNGFVLLDKAESMGFMGLPDILGKTVTVDGVEAGKVEKVGPLGFVTAMASGSGLDGKYTTRHFFPWTVKVRWNDFVDISIEDQIKSASIHELEAFGVQLRVPRGLDHWDYAESTESYRAKLLQAVRQYRNEK